MRDLTLVGEPRPIAQSALEACAAIAPVDYLQLMATWGPGIACGMYELADPSEPRGRFRYWQQQLRLRGSALHSRGHWGALTEAQLATGLVLGIDRAGTALFTHGPHDVVLLRTDGKTTVCADFVHALGRARDPYDHHRAPPPLRCEDVDLGVPHTYVTASDARARFVAAVMAGDEAAANAALQDVLASEVALYALLDLAELIAARAEVPGATRAEHVDQLLRMARRRGARLFDKFPLREIRIALETTGELTPELAARLAIMPKPAGIFAAAFDAIEVSLLAELVAHPDDVAVRLVYADHLEDLGEVARADALRAETAAPPPVPDALARGLIAPPNMPPIDGEALLAGYVERWRIDDPETAIDDLVARLAALHPEVRQGYAVLLAQSGDYRAVHSDQHLGREMADAWPLLALALRTPRMVSLRLLVEHGARDASPYILSALRHPAPEHTAYEATRLADAYIELGPMTPALVDDYVRELASPEPGRRAIAFRMLQDHGADDRVFEGYLQHFADAHPFSESAIKRRKKDPRVLPALLAAFAIEEKRSLRDGRKLAYTTGYGLLASFLAKLGDARGKEAAANYRRFVRWSQAPRDRERM